MGEWKEVYRERNTLGGIMKVGDLVWARWEMYTMGVIIKVLFEDNMAEVYYRVRWLTDGWARESLEFQEDLMTEKERLKVESI